jgi:hypothetical protein
MYETPIDSELFYVHHARNSTSAERALYTTRLTLHFNESAEAGQSAEMVMHLTTDDQPLPRGTTPISIHTNNEYTTPCNGRNVLVELSVLSVSGASFELAEASNRVVLREGNDDLVPLYSTLLEDERTTLMLFRRYRSGDVADALLYYQRRSHLGGWQDVVSSRVPCSS